MIKITKGQAVPDQEGVRVAADSGEYADADLILCSSDVGDIMFQAQFIAYGLLVYQFNTPEELGGAIVAIDPTSTHDGAQLFREEEERKAKRLKGTLAPEDPVEAADAIEPVATPEDDAEAALRRARDARRAEDKRLAEEVEQDAVTGGALTDTEDEVVEFVPVETTPPATDLPAIDVSTTTPD